MSSTRTATVVVPVFNEEASIATLVAEIDRAFSSQPEWTYSLLFVDDGSTDGTWDRIQAAVDGYAPTVRAIRLRRNFGKSEALSLGFRRCDSEVVITMDGDLQDDPSEIPRLLERIDAGFDVVSGWKKQRHDPISKRLPSRLFNFVTSRITGVPLHDINSGFKAYRADAVRAISLHGEMHRYIPVIAAHLGFSVCEVPVNHRPRVHGRSKFGAERYVRGLLDLVTVFATTRYLKRPGHLFGGVGLLIGIVGLVCLIYLSMIRFLDLGAIGNRPLLLFGILCVLLAAQMISLGVIAELFLRQQPAPPDQLRVRDIAGLVPRQYSRDRRRAEAGR